MYRKPKLETTTLWDFPSREYGEGNQGSREFPGATPSWVVWNLLCRYTRKKDLVVDPMAGSGTTLDVARELDRRALAYDLTPVRDEVFRADARKLPLETEKADFVFVDPPYSDHIHYSDDVKCIGNLSAVTRDYYKAMEHSIREMVRVLKPGRYMALYVCDSFVKGKPFAPIGMELYKILEKYLEPVDVICVSRKNAKLKRNHWHTSAVEGNYFLRGFNYLFVMYKPDPRKKGGALYPDRRDPEEIAARVAERRPRGPRDGRARERAAETGGEGRAGRPDRPKKPREKAAETAGERPPRRPDRPKKPREKAAETGGEGRAGRPDRPKKPREKAGETAGERPARRPDRPKKPREKAAETAGEGRAGRPDRPKKPREKAAETAGERPAGRPGRPRKPRP